jgi:hypothetical protein
VPLRVLVVRIVTGVVLVVIVPVRTVPGWRSPTLFF